MGCSSSASAQYAYQEDECNFHARYVLGEKNGSGSFAQVRVARTVSGRKASQEQAVKIISLSEDASLLKRQLQAVHREVQTWATVGSHSNCVSLLEVFQSAEMCYMVMEKCNGSLLQHLERMPSLTERTMGNAFHQMISGLAHVHAAGVVHRDIKPENYLIGRDGNTLKLCDFGLSASLDESRKLQGVFGTAPFMCPEMLAGYFYDEKADIWSLGVVVYVLLFGGFPYVPQERGARSMKTAILSGSPPSYQACHGTGKSALRTDVAVGFVKVLLNREPENRPSATDALEMTYMEAVSKDSHARGQDLPSLRSALKGATKAGAFEMRQLEEDDTFDVLNALQIKMHRVSISEYKVINDISSASHTDLRPHAQSDFSVTDLKAHKGSDFSNADQRQHKGSDFSSASTTYESSSLRSRSGSCSPSSLVSPSRKGTDLSASSYTRKLTEQSQFSL